jgi:hypothetical protein
MDSSLSLFCFLYGEKTWLAQYGSPFPLSTAPLLSLSLSHLFSSWFPPLLFVPRIWIVPLSFMVDTSPLLGYSWKQPLHKGFLSHFLYNLASKHKFIWLWCIIGMGWKKCPNFVDWISPNSHQMQQMIQWSMIEQFILKWINLDKLLIYYDSDSLDFHKIFQDLAKPSHLVHKRKNIGLIIS